MTKFQGYTMFIYVAAQLETIYLRLIFMIDVLKDKNLYHITEQ